MSPNSRPLNQRPRAASLMQLPVAACLVCLAALIAGGRALHADDAAGIVLSEEWRMLSMDGQPAGSTHSVKTQIMRDGVVIVATDEFTSIQSERFGQSSDVSLRYHSEESVEGERLRFSAFVEIPGSPFSQIMAEVQGSELVVTTIDGEQTFETRLAWTPELAAGMRFQSHFDNFAWQTGDMMTIETYGLFDGLMTAKFTAKGEIDLTLFDGSTRTLMHVERVNTLADGTTDTTDYYLSPADGIVAEQRNGMVSEQVADPSTIETLLPAETVTPPTEFAAGQLIEEFWEAANIADARVGHAHTTVQRIDRDGTPLIVEDQTGLLTTTRFGEEQTMSVSSVTERTLDGQLIRMTETYESEGTLTTVLDALVSGGELIITSTTGDVVEEQRIPWTDDLVLGMQFAASLEAYAWQPGDEITHSEYGFSTGVFTATYFNRGETDVSLFDGSVRTLLHIEKQSSLFDGTLDVVHFYIEPGIGTIRMELIGLDMTMERVPQEVATDTSVEMHETGTVIEVSLPSTIDPMDFYSVTEAVYILTLEGLEAAAVSSDLRQTVTQRGTDTVKVRINSSAIISSEATEEELAICLAGGDHIDLTDPTLIALADEGTLGAVTTLDKALALELFVGDLVANDYLHLFDSASQVAINRAGDCTEHSVLLISLLRLNGIPARGAAGLIVDGPGHNAMGHMWVEAYIDGVWMPLDAVRMGGDITPAYIKFADWDLLENEASSAEFLRAISVWQSPLQIEVRAIELP